jgi:hypothetical protein
VEKVGKLTFLFHSLNDPSIAHLFDPNESDDA